MPNRPQFDCAAAFDEVFSADALVAIFQKKFSNSAAKGVDRRNGFQFSANAADELAVAARKCSEGTFRFSPFRENLKHRGRLRAPRLISIPTIRDRVILHQLKDLLGTAFPECVPRNVASTLVRKIATDLRACDPETTYVGGCDIRDFYDNIKWRRLLSAVGQRLTDKRALDLVARSLQTPTVPDSARRNEYKAWRKQRGVPQGLAVSNVLASIFMATLDTGMRALPGNYLRYVDDVLVYGTEQEVRHASAAFIARCRARGLPVHGPGSGKTHLGSVRTRFGYLGYLFRWPEITVREATVERLLQSIAAKFSNHKHNRDKFLRGHKHLNVARYDEIFLAELNERITGAISEGRRYGWIAYFSEISDLTLLHKLDNVVRRMFKRLPDFEGKPPAGLRSFARAYFEIKFNPKGGYVRDFDKIVSPVEMLRFLNDRGRIEPTDALTDDAIEGRYFRYRHAILGAMQADEGMIY